MKRIWKVMIVLALFGSCESTVLAQSKKYYVDPRLPSVFLAPVESPDGASKDNSSTKDKRILIRLVNNLKWDIGVLASGAKAGYGDARVEHEIVDATGKIVGGFRCHVCGVTTVASGSSIAFSITEAEMRADYKLRVRFSYGWESEIDSELEIEPSHYVFFHFTKKSLGSTD